MVYLVRGLSSFRLNIFEKNFLKSRPRESRLKRASQLIVRSVHVESLETEDYSVVDGVKEPARMGRDPEAPKNQEL